MIGFAQRIRTIRKEQRLTQIDVIKKQKKIKGIPPLTQSTLSRLENGELLPPAAALYILSTIYQVSADYLLTGKDNCHEKENR